MRYFALGGMSRPLELDAIVHDALHTSPQDRDLVVHALNERFTELGSDESVPYSDDVAVGTDAPCAPARQDLVVAESAEPTDEAEHAALLRRAVDALDGQDASLFRRLARAQKQHAYRDALTGAMQRDAGCDQLQRALDQAHRTGQPLTVVFIDVDHLKQTNDAHGHAAGDLLLQALGGALRESLRSYDLVIRYGGDEFVCALPHAGQGQAGERLAQVSARLEAAVPGASVSAGYSALREGDTLYEVLRRADEDMYANRRRQRLRTAGTTVPVTVDAGYARALRALLVRLFRAALGREPRP